MIQFTWNEEKNKANIIKHGVSFEESMSVFLDYDGIIIYDEPHSENEDRFILIGLSNKQNILVVCHCCRENDQIIRIISARKADKGETRDYYERKTI